MNYHIKHNNGWKVNGKSFATKLAAQKWAREQAKLDKTYMVIHDKQGNIYYVADYTNPPTAGRLLK